MLSIQRLDVYQRAIEFLALVGDIAGELPKGHAERSDQLVRAAESVVRAALLDIMKLRRVVATEKYEYGIRLLESVVAMLTKMI
jgi:hypothetical protein